MDVDDTLVLILERIDSIVGLIRAASTCRRWRRIIADVGFLRRYRSLHGPPVAGDYHNIGWPIHDAAGPSRGYGPIFMPSSSIIDERHFSLDFVTEFRSWNSYQSWNVLDSRGSLLLMECHDRVVFPDHLIVCEPVTQRQRWMIIPQLPDFDGANWKLQASFLVDSDEEDESEGFISMSNFRVSCALVGRDDDDVVVCTTVFTADIDTDEMWSEEAIDSVDTSENRAYHPCDHQFSKLAWIDDRIVCGVTWECIYFSDFICGFVEQK